MTTGQIIGYSFLGVMWLALCWLLLKMTQVITLQTIFVIVASAIIVFVPIYKKHKRNGNASGK